jgi:hypothetical protein
MQKFKNDQEKPENRLWIELKKVNYNAIWFMTWGIVFLLEILMAVIQPMSKLETNAMMVVIITTMLILFMPSIYNFLKEEVF